MLTVTGNRIEIPQGETASVDFAFKDQINNAPFILSNRNLKHSILVTIRDGVVENKSQDIIQPKEYDIDINSNDRT